MRNGSHITDLSKLKQMEGLATNTLHRNQTGNPKFLGATRKLRRLLPRLVLKWVFGAQHL